MRKVIICCFTLLLGGPLSAFADTQIKVGQMTADGLEVHDLSCKLRSGGGLFASMAIVGALAKQKKAIDACAPEGAAFQVSLVWAGGKTSEAKVEKGSKDAASACVTAALKKISAPAEGTCSAVILAGNAQQARAAAKGLSSGDAPAAEDPDKKPEKSKKRSKKKSQS